MGRAVVSPGDFRACRSARLLPAPIGRKARERYAPAALAARLHPLHAGYHAGRVPRGERIAMRLGARTSLAPRRGSGPGGGTRAREKTAQFPVKPGSDPGFPPILSDWSANPEGKTADGKPGSVPGFTQAVYRRRDRGFRETAAGWRAATGCRSAREASAWRGGAPGGFR